MPRPEAGVGPARCARARKTPASAANGDRGDPTSLQAPGCTLDVVSGIDLVNLRNKIALRFLSNGLKTDRIGRVMTRCGFNILGLDESVSQSRSQTAVSWGKILNRSSMPSKRLQNHLKPLFLRRCKLLLSTLDPTFLC